jgi:hypothetical protein
LTVDDRDRLRAWLERLCEVSDPGISNGPVLARAEVEISIHYAENGHDTARLSAQALLRAIGAWAKGELYLPEPTMAEF